eukprot:15420566-Alexandrium_andersonii.AAC.1
MSASLVGSEMCIRDSAGPPPDPAAARCVTGASSPTPPGASGRPAVEPVSYTHLTLPTICSV